MMLVSNAFYLSNMSSVADPTDWHWQVMDKTILCDKGHNMDYDGPEEEVPSQATFKIRSDRTGSGSERGSDQVLSRCSM